MLRKYKRIIYYFFLSVSVLLWISSCDKEVRYNTDGTSVIEGVFDFYENDIYLPTLSDNICHNNTELGLPGFLVVFPQRLGDVTNLQFKRFYFKNEECIKDEKQYVYTLKR